MDLSNNLDSLEELLSYKFSKRELLKLSLTHRSFSQENNEIYEFDYLIISDGVFSKSKNLLSKNQIEPKFNDTLAIRGIIPSSSNIADKKNISLFLGPNFHYVIYPVSRDGDLNFIAVMKYKLPELSLIHI